MARVFVVLDTGSVFAWAAGDPKVRAYIQAGAEAGAVFVVPSVIIAESIRGSSSDVTINRILKKTEKIDLDEATARRAGAILGKSGSPRRSATKSKSVTIDAIVVAHAETLGNTRVLTGDPIDIRSLSFGLSGVSVVDVTTCI